LPIAIVGIPRGLGNCRQKRQWTAPRPIPLIFHDYVGQGIATIAKPFPQCRRTFGQSGRAFRNLMPTIAAEALANLRES
jgi:hypothetical protein